MPAHDFSIRASERRGPNPLASGRASGAAAMVLTLRESFKRGVGRSCSRDRGHLKAAPEPKAATDAPELEDGCEEVAVKRQKTASLEEELFACTLQPASLEGLVVGKCDHDDSLLEDLDLGVIVDLEVIDFVV